MQIEFLTEIIAKALCFEKYIALHNIEEIDNIELTNVFNYYIQHEKTYLNKATALLNLVNDATVIKEFSHTKH